MTNSHKYDKIRLQNIYEVKNKLFDKIGNGNIKTAYLIIICISFLLSAYFFASFFIINGKIESETVTPIENEIKETENTPKTETDSKIDQYQKEISIYDKILSSSYLTVANSSNPLPDGYEQTALVECESNPAVKLEAITAIKIQEFIDAAREAGFNCKVIVGYRTYAEQETIYNKELQSLMNAGYPKETAEAMAKMTVAQPGQSEYETGYLVQIAENSQMTAAEFENSELFTYIKENIYKYGFILRYPQGKESVTGYSYNPFCFRYIGEEGMSDGVLSVSHAQYIYEKNLTLEEYIDYIKNKRAVAEQSQKVLQGAQD